MTECEAIEILSEFLFPQLGYTDKAKEAIQMAINALEKQVAKKPMQIDEDMGIFDCPNCGHTIIAIDDMTIHQNCLMCGQRLDWSD